MTLARVWQGRRDKPRIDPFVRPGVVDLKWGWAWDHQVAAWLFNEPGGDTLRDVLSRATGTLVAGTGSKPTWGRDGQLWGLTPIDSGATSGIDIGGDSLGDNFAPEQISVETWSKWPPGVADGGPEDPRLFSKQSSGALDGHFIMVGSINSAGSQGDGPPRMRLRTGGSTTTHIVSVTPQPLEGNLVHVVWTYDGATVLCYINGVSASITTGGSQSGAVNGGTSVPTRIGNAAYSGAANEWAATIYKVAIYDTALVASQVLALSGNPYGPYRRVRRRVGFVVAAVPTGIGGAYYQQYLRTVIRV